MAGESFLRSERADGLLTVFLARPPVNVLHVPMMAELQAVLDAASEDRDLRAILITGTGERVFSAGVEVADHTRERIVETMEAFHPLLARLRDHPLPIAAGLNGAALGGGCELALACDMIVAAPGARLGQPEIKLASLALPATLLLQGRLPANLIAEMLLGGEPLAADEAHRRGLVNRIIADDDFLAGCRAFMARFTGLSRPVVALMKKALAEARGASYEAGMAAMERITLDELLPLEDSGEGLDAFLEKRPPRWRHR